MLEELLCEGGGGGESGPVMVEGNARSNLL